MERTERGIGSEFNEDYENAVQSVRTKKG